MKEKTVLVLKYLTGFMFLLSGFSKLFPIEPFELIIVNQKIIGWELVPYLSRLIIGFEIFLGFALLQRAYIKKVFLPAAFLLLVIFDLQLIYSMIFHTAGDNCGCFGEVISMTPTEALIKNIAVMLVILWVYKNYKSETYKLPVIVGYLVFSYAVVLYISPITAYVLPDNPVVVAEKDSLAVVADSMEIIPDAVKDSALSKPLIVKKETPPAKDSVVTRSVFYKYTQFSDGVRVNLDSGIKIVVLFSLDCEHCLETATKLNRLRSASKLPPVYVLFFGEEEMIPGFFNAAGGAFPYKIIPPQEFFPLITAAPPRLVYLQNGKITGDFTSSMDIIGELQKLLSRD